MARSYKTTGCFRFVLFIVILAPLAYLGASYYNGQDGVQNIKNFFSKAKTTIGLGMDIEKSSTPNATTSTTPSLPAATEAEITNYKSTISIKDQELNALIKENLDLKLKLQECENKIKIPEALK
ncbi:MAG: hypothetical protein IPF93_19900 [Saprospiraceae bacterium]|nr:hypothetical protein [Saprospiraceae bacterium]